MAFVGCGAGAAVARGNGAVRMCEQRAENAPPAKVSRRQALAQVLGGAVGAWALVANAPNASAVGGAGGSFSSTVFPKEGLSALTPGKVSVDQAIVKDPKTQQALKDLQEYRKKVAAIMAEFKGNPQMDVGGAIRKTFNLSVLRDDLNKVNLVFDEETQKSTDRVVRAIIQDIQEVETAAVVKKGYERSPKKVERTKRWIEQLEGDFDKLLGLY